MFSSSSRNCMTQWGGNGRNLKRAFTNCCIVITHAFITSCLRFLRITMYGTDWLNSICLEVLCGLKLKNSFKGKRFCWCFDAAIKCEKCLQNIHQTDLKNCFKKWKCCILCKCNIYVSLSWQEVLTNSARVYF